MATKQLISTKQLVTRKLTDLEKAEKQVVIVMALDNDVKAFAANLEMQKEKLKKMLRKMPYNRITVLEGYGFELQQYKKTEIKNDESAMAWGLENPQARMAVQVAKVTKAFEGKNMPKWATRIHAEKLMPIKPKNNHHETD